MLRRRVVAALLLGSRCALLVLRATVRIVVVLVAGTALALAAAVAGVVSHRGYSCFCGVRMVRFCWCGCGSRRAGVGIGDRVTSGVRVDQRTGAVLTGEQGFGLLESDDDLAVGLPPLLVNVPGQVPGESPCGELGIGVQPVEVGGAESDDVFIRCEQPAARQRADAVGSFPAQQRFQLGGHDRAAEHPGEHVAQAVLEHALDALNQTFLVAHRTAPSLPSMVSAGRAIAAEGRLRELDPRSSGWVRARRSGPRPSSAAGAADLGMTLHTVIRSAGLLGEWRNGRRAGFRCQCPSGRGGSSPPSPTDALSGAG